MVNMSFMDILKKTPEVEEKIVKFKSPKYKTMPVYDYLKDFLESKAGQIKDANNKPIAVADLISQIDTKLEQATKGKSLSEDEIKEKEKTLNETKETLKNLPTEKDSKQVYPSRVKMLESKLEEIVSLVDAFTDASQDPEIQAEMKRKDKDGNLLPPRTNVISGLGKDAREENLKDKEEEWDKRSDEIYDKLDELEGAQGEEAQSEINELEDQLKTISEERKEAKKKTNPYDIWLDSHRKLRNHFYGVFDYKSMLNDEQIEGTRKAAKPRNDSEGEWDFTYKVGIENYKKRIAEYKSMQGKRDKSSVRDSKKMLEDKIAALTKEIQTGKASKSLLLTSQQFPKTMKPATKVGSYDIARETFLSNAVKELGLRNENSILDLLNIEQKVRTPKQFSEKSEIDMTLEALLEEINSEDISRQTKVRLQTNGLLTNRFLYNLSENVLGNRNNIHQEVINQLSENDSPTPLYALVVERLKELNPKLKSIDKGKMREVMGKLRTTKTTVANLARQVKRKDYPREAEWEEMIKLNTPGDLAKLLKKLKQLDDSWETISDMYYLKEDDAEFNEEDIEGWNDKKVVAEFNQEWFDLLEFVEEEMDENTTQAKWREHLANYYKKQLTRIKKIFEEYQFYFSAAIKLTQALGRARGFKYQTPQTKDWPGLLWAKTGETQEDMEREKQSIIDFDTTAKELKERWNEIKQQKESMFNFIPDEQLALNDMLGETEAERQWDAMRQEEE